MGYEEERLPLTLDLENPPSKQDIEVIDSIKYKDWIVKLKLNGSFDKERPFTATNSTSKAVSNPPAFHDFKLLLAMQTWI
jgi:hypothetical protein